MSLRDFGQGFNQPFFGGGEIVEALAEAFITDASFAGHNYMIDWSAELPLRFQSVPTIREQQDGSDAPGEHSLNPEGLWRRSGESWHLGAEQEEFDRKESLPYRFDDSFGMDVWTRWEMSQLPGVEGKVLSANTNLLLVSTPSRVYMTNGNNIGFYTTLTPGIQAMTNLTGVPANNPSSIITDGFNVWTAHGASGIYRNNTGSGATASQVTGTVSLLGYVRNRVMAANNNVLYEVTAQAYNAAPPVALPAALFTHPNTNFVWKSFAEGQGFIYAAGYSGDKSLIYKITLTQEGTVLAAPTVAAEPPVGEQVEFIYGYLGKFMFIGTNKGWRLAIISSNGDLQLGVLIKTAYTVRSAHGEGPFIYYGAEDYDNLLDANLYTGMARLSTEFFVDLDTLQPAHANDSMVLLNSSHSGVTSIVTYQGRKFYTINGIGLTGVLHPDTGNLMPFSYVTTGQITFNMTEPKRAVWVDHFHTGIGTFNIYLAVNTGDFTLVGTHVVEEVDEQMPSFALGDIEGKGFNFLIQLVPDTDPTKGLTFKSYTLRAQPRPNVTNIIYATFLLGPAQVSLEDSPIYYDVHDELDFIENKHAQKMVETLTLGRRAYEVTLEDYDYLAHSILREWEGLRGIEGSILCKFKRLDPVGFPVE